MTSEKLCPNLPPLLFLVLCRTMWTGEGEVQVKARMETTLAMGVPSISVSQQQAPKKFAPVVAPKPKFNPYKDPTDLAGGKRGRK